MNMPDPERLYLEWLAAARDFNMPEARAYVRGGQAAVEALRKREIEDRDHIRGPDGRPRA